MIEKTDSVCKKFDDFFKIRSNVIYYERARFYKRNQLPGESAEKYIMELYTRARNCNWKIYLRDDQGPPSNWNQRQNIIRKQDPRVNGAWLSKLTE